MDFMSRVVPLNIVYLEAIPEGKIPQGTNSDVESDDDQLITRTRMTTSSSGRVHDVDCEGSSAPPSKKRNLTVNLDALARDWRLLVEQVRQILTKHNASKQHENVERRSSKVALNFSPLREALMNNV